MASSQTQSFSESIMTVKKLFILSICILCISCSAFNFAHANSIAFSKAQLDKVKTDYKGKQWLMLLWSVDCPPCFKELATLQALQKDHNDLAVVIINSDADNELTEEREAVIKNFELSQVTHFHFVDGKADQSRFWVDPQWFGELPRSYFFAKNGDFYAKSGLVNEAMLKAWLLP